MAWRLVEGSSLVSGFRFLDAGRSDSLVSLDFSSEMDVVSDYMSKQ